MHPTGPTLFSIVFNLLVCPFNLAHSIPLPHPALAIAVRDDSLLVGVGQIIDIAESTSPPDSPTPDSSAPATDSPLEITTNAELLFGPPMTVTVPAPTVTDIITVFVSSSSSSPSTSSISPSSQIPPANSPTGTTWSAPARMSDLSAFNVLKFAGQTTNLRLVDGIPATATSTPTSSPSPTSGSSGGILGLVNVPGLGALLQANPASPPQPSQANSAYTTWDNKTTVIQLFYPARSVNPGAKDSPKGGAEFYASPLPIKTSRSVTMEYSAFFPDGFNWVQGGKLPGLYGGKMGCSGGDAALDCFSTRLMWRKNGQGELYLYADKDKQTSALCRAPGSECNAKYGFSIGRGSFSWATGMWTHVAQTVTLNTPGEQDGVFTLVVNGKQVIHREDICYRDLPPNSSPTQSPPAPSPTTSSTDGGLGGILGPILGGVGGLIGITRRWMALPDAVPFSIAQPTAVPQRLLLLAGPEGVILVHDALPSPGSLEFSPDQDSADSSNTTTVYPTMAPSSEQAAPRSEPVSFSGIFFSTFFGGQGPEWATPDDQYTWFKDFSLVSHS
ncbi:hypothetical protein C8F01DRAFT_85895 [Mycena amicta]|nr:hypothetical protein C8F01DRAFT_85895 [Mycena amicta]